MKGTARMASVLGASGYGGAELLRLLAGHPEIAVKALGAASSAGLSVEGLYPGLASSYGGAVYEMNDPSLAEGCDVVFCALPHGESQVLVPELSKRAPVVVDLAADFRLKDESLYPIWYGEPHSQPELLAGAAFGIPELFRAEIIGAGLVAVAGCYVTATALALAPLVSAGVVEPTGIIVDAVSGVSGAGRSPSATTHFGSVNENFSAYGLLSHRHTPEIEQALGHGAQVLFTPHLAPMTRGILATCYARPSPATSAPSTMALLDLLRSAYEDEPFVTVMEDSPGTKATLGSNMAHLTARFDPRTGWVMVVCALDNLVKGAAGQAIQCANLALGIEETTGLPTQGMVP